MALEFDGLVWLLLLVGPLFLLQRRVHFEIQAVFLMLTRRADMVPVLFSLVFLPGVMIHELSHYLVARLVGVRTGRFSILPQTVGDGKLQLGYVETASSDWLRDSMIGAAPLLSGSLVVTWLARGMLGFDRLVAGIQSGNFGQFGLAVQSIVKTPDFWLWFYLLFAISSTMLPSASDRRAWIPMTGLTVVLIIIALSLGVGPWLLQNLAPALFNGLRALAAVFGVSALTHLLLLLPILLLRRILSRMTGLEVRV